MTIVDEIVANGGGSGDLMVIDADGLATTVPWAAIHERARRIATRLGPGRPRVALLADTSVELVATIQGVWLAGGAVSVLPSPASPALLADARPDLVLADHPLPGAQPLRALAAEAAALTPAEPVRPDPGDLAILQYSSGSTRRPRAVPVTHGHLAANLNAIRLATRHGEAHHGPMLSWLPLFHDMGLVGFLALPMTCGCSLVLESPVRFASRPASWLEGLSKYRATTSAAPNFVYGLLARLLPSRPDLDLSCVSSLISGGEPVDPAAMSAFIRAAATVGLAPEAVVPAYGLAESTLAVSFTPRRRGLRVDRVDAVRLERDGRVAPGTRALARLGPPVPTTSVRIVDRLTGEALGERLVGRIEVAGPSVVGHYWNEPAPAPGAWFDTGDLGYLVDGELVVCGRTKDVIFAAGRTIFPQDVELAASNVPAVRSGGAAAFAVADAAGDRLVVAVESGGGAPVDAIRHDVRAAVRGSVGLTPHAVVVVPARRLPRTTSGKLRRGETRRQYLEGIL